jgi:phage terminase small subunit
MPRKSRAALHFPTINGAQRLQPPPGLDEATQRVFIGLVASCPADHFRPGDTPLLLAYAGAVLTEREATEHLAKDGRVIDGRPSPWINIQTQAIKSMAMLARALKLSPQARRPTPSRPGKEPPLSYYEKMQLEGSGE